MNNKPRYHATRQGIFGCCRHAVCFYCRQPRMARGHDTGQHVHMTSAKEEFVTAPPQCALCRTSFPRGPPGCQRCSAGLACPSVYWPWNAHCRRCCCFQTAAGSCWLAADDVHRGQTRPPLSLDPPYTSTLKLSVLSNPALDPMQPQPPPSSSKGLLYVSISSSSGLHGRPHCCRFEGT